MYELLENKPNNKLILLGNEAIVRGALESGVNFVSTYPGTPASEIGNIFSQIAKEANIYFEFSTNEKVALEAAIGASFSGLKTLVAMKSFGINVALDSLLPLVYTGTKGAMVIVVADDPGCWSSAQTEENSRGFAYISNIPVLEPADAQECLNFIKLGFQLSEQSKLPIIIRTTTRVAHQSAPVVLGEIKKITHALKGKFIKDHNRFVTFPPRVLEMKTELLEKIKKIQAGFEQCKINFILNQNKNKKIGIIASGISYLHVMEVVRDLNMDLPVLKLGTFFPLPENKINNFIKNLNTVLIVEELDPYLEKEVQRIAKDSNPKLKIFGKDVLPEVGELRPEYVSYAITKAAGKMPEPVQYNLKIKHLPRFCPGCPYWLVFGAIKKFAPEGTIFGGDIGCYMLGGLPPHDLYDYLFGMGSSIGIAHGIDKAGEQKLVTFIGDSTFFHSGIPGLINTVFNKSNQLVFILDNQTTAMTGHQTNPSIGRTGMGEETT